MAESVEFHSKKLLKAKELEDAYEHIDALKEMGEISIPALVKVLEHENYDVSRLGTDALAEIGAPAVPALIKAIVSKNHIVFRITSTLVKIGKPALPELFKALGHDNDEVVMRSADVLGDIRDNEALVPLMKLTGEKPQLVNSIIKKAIKKIQEANRGKER